MTENATIGELEKSKQITKSSTQATPKLLFFLFTVHHDDYDGIDVLFFAMLTHGKGHGKILVRDGYVSTKDVMSRIANAPGLLGKPKIILFQACRGAEIDKGCDAGNKNGRTLARSNEVEDESDEAEEEDTETFLARNVDTLLIYPSCKGFVSFGNKRSGTWFVDSLCQVLSIHGRQKEITEILTVVNRLVSEMVGWNEEEKIVHAKQTAELKSRLTKKLYLNLSKQ